ncbi:homoserine kinase [Maridesulfovibrio hydrothermalis]|uniref:Shikimate kinase n=1 Tax=Maridesulfovibrio hydrothermalis AM13 = DSM 14728 TaxID=1121451 RepID=L0R743_9BACT|nr:homoserine kinase [Maridesulfovibrio hydrothermalis]CCO22559.1 Shikimate kinase 1 [Maridesulfovibrio hydrothermalis AM13 = DSM 14728]
MEEWNANFSEDCSVSLIGMAGAGKSTLAPLLAAKLGWEYIDTDSIIEAYYGRALQGIVDNLGVPAFRKAEEYLLSSLGVVRTVISTGGSVVYGEKAMERLKSLGPVIYLHIDCETCIERVGGGEGRGLARSPGQSLESLYEERASLYEKYADFTVDTYKFSPEECAEKVFQWLGSIEKKQVKDL